jgi:hypothetical protein
MSILVVRMNPYGILIGADRNITAARKLSDGTNILILQGQSQRPKVLKWPNRDVVIGYVGQARFDGKAADDWLYSFIGRNLEFESLGSVAASLRAELSRLFARGNFDDASVLHLAGFEMVDGQWTPRIFYIRNTVGGTDEVGNDYQLSDEIADQYFVGKTGDEIWEWTGTHALMFRQGFDLAAFNIIDQKVREATVEIVAKHPQQPIRVPASLDEWAKHVAFSIHAYAAYFAAFYPAYEQYVGGGADVVSSAWPGRS